MIQRIKALSEDPVRLVQVFMVCRQAGVLISSVVIAQLLPVEKVGVIEMLMLAGYLLTFFWSDALLKGYLSKSTEIEKTRNASSFLWMYFGLAALVMLLLYMGQKFLLPLLVDRPGLPGLHLFVLYQAMILPVWIAPFTGLLRLGEIKMLSAYVMIAPFLSAWIGYLVHPDLTGMLIGWVVMGGIGLVWIMSKTVIIKRQHVQELASLVWPAVWPLVLYAASAGLARGFDGWLVARFFDESTFAVFRYGAREFPFVLAMAAGLSTIMIPKLRELSATEELRQRSTRLMHICYPLIGIAMLISQPLFVFVFGEAYRESAYLFNIYLLLALTQLVFPQSIMIAQGDQKILWYVSLAELTVNIVFSLWLLHWIGLPGIAWGTVIAFVFEKIVLMVILQNRKGISVVQYISLPVWIGYILLLSTLFIFSKWMFGM